jgi:hypothetical protein
MKTIVPDTLISDAQPRPIFTVVQKHGSFGFGGGALRDPVNFIHVIPNAVVFNPKSGI